MVLEFAFADVGGAAGGGYAMPAMTIAPQSEVLSIAVLAVHLKELILSTGLW